MSEANNPKGLAESKYPELLADVAAHTVAVLVERFGLGHEQAEEAGRSVAEQLRRAWAGQLIYFPKGVSFDAMQRYEELWRAFNGHNQKELAARFGLSEPHVYAVLKLMQKEVARRNQKDMFATQE